MPRCTTPSSLCYTDRRLSQISGRSRKLSLALKAHANTPLPDHGHPIQRLPLEILALIMVHAVEADGAQLPANSTMAPWNITQVCSGWRLLAISTPQLWNTISFNVKSMRCLRAAEEIFKRSKALPLTISISWLPLTGWWVDTALESILGHFSMRSRLRRFELTMDKQVFDVIQRCFQFRSWSFPNLQHLQLSFIESGPRPAYEVHQPVDVHLPGIRQLKSLVISAGKGLDNLTVRMTSIDTSALTHLSLLGIKETPADALGLLQTSSHLTHFSVGLHSHLGGHSAVINEESFTSMSHDSLRCMDLVVYGSRPTTGLVEFLRPLTASELASLKISFASLQQEGMTLEPHYAEFLQRSPLLDMIVLDN